MLVKAQRFSFTEVNKSLGAASSLPYLPLTLSHRSTSLSVSGLLDTGATINVLPYDVGRQLGVVWDQQTTPVHLTGNLGGSRHEHWLFPQRWGNLRQCALRLPGHEQTMSL